jgi:F-type H+-transporting ATPase subunit epsilon
MTTLREGKVTVKDGATTKVFDIQGGFADVGPDGLTILAEHAVEAA